MLIKKVGIKYLILFILVYFLLNIDHAAAQLNDIDNDLLNNQIESLLGTNPAIKDSDQDGLTDAEEFIQGSNPKDADTDDNGISDGEEKRTKTGNKFFDDLNDSFQNNSLENEESGFSGNFPQEDKDKNLGTSKTNKKRTSSNSEKTRTKDLNIDENNEIITKDASEKLSLSFGKTVIIKEISRNKLITAFAVILPIAILFFSLIIYLVHKRRFHESAISRTMIIISFILILIILGNFLKSDNISNISGLAYYSKPICVTFDSYSCEDKESYISVFGNGLNLQAKDRCSENLNYQFSCLPDNILKGCVQKCNIGCDINSCRKTIETAKRENVELLGSWGGPTLTTAVSDPLVFSGSGGGFYILNATNKFAPVILGRFATSGKVNGLSVSNGYLFIGAGNNGLSVYNVSDPYNAFLVSHFDTPGFARNIFILNNILYLADSSGGLRIIDVSDKLLPREMGFYAAEKSNFYSVYVKDNIAYVTERETEKKKGNLLALDISNPELVSVLSSVDLGWGNVAYGLDVLNNKAYVAAGPTGLVVVDISDPRNLKVISKIYLGSAVLDAKVKDNFAYTTLGGGLGLKIIDISDPKNLKEKGNISTADNANVVRLAGNFAFIANDDAGLRIMDITNPSSPKQVYSFVASSVVYDVFVENNRVYSLDTDVGVLVADIKENNEYEIIGQYQRKYSRPQPLSARGIYAKNGFIYLADGDAGFRVLDARNINQIREISYFDPLNSSFSAVEIVGNLAFVSDLENQGLRIIDISNPNKIFEIGHWFNSKGKELNSVCNPRLIDSRDRPPYNIKIKDNKAYLSAGHLIIIDISNPKNPREINRIDPGGNVRSVSIEQNYIAIASNTQGLKLIDISSICNPKNLGSFKIPEDVGKAADVQVRDNIAYIAYEDYGLFVIDLSDPNNLKQIGFYDTPNSARNLQIYNNKIFLADADTGVLVFEYQP